MPKDREQVQRQELSRKKTSNRGLMILLAVLIVVCAVAGAIYVDTFHGSGKLQNYVTQIFQKEGTAKTAKNTQAPNMTMTMDDSTRASIAVFGEAFFLCTKDGVKYFETMGDQRWNDTFNMNTPQMVQEGDFVAVGDLGGKSVRVYGKAGLLYSVQTEGALMQFGLNENGYVSMITNEEKGYRVQVYNVKGVLLKGRVEESSGVYPLSSDVSDDNKAFAVSYLDTTDIAPMAKVLFFYINPQDSEEHTDSMFAGVEKSGEIIPTIAYLNGGTLAAISDKVVYGINSSGQESWQYELGNSLMQAALTAKDHVVIALGESFANAEGRGTGTVVWLDTSGKEVAVYAGEKAVTYLKSTDKGVIIGNEKEYTGLKNSGKVIWTYRSAADVRDIIPMTNLNKVLLVTKESATITEMKGEQVAEPKQEETKPEAKPAEDNKEGDIKEDTAPQDEKDSQDSQGSQDSQDLQQPKKEDVEAQGDEVEPT